MIPARTVFTVDISGTVSGWIPPTETSVRQSLIVALSGQWVVTSVVVDSPVINNPFKWDYVATAQLAAATSYDQGRAESDISKTVQTTFGYIPTVSIRPPGSVVSSQPPIDDPIASVVMGTGSVIKSTVEGATSAAGELFSGVKSTVTLAVVGILILAAVVAFSPTGKAAARGLTRG